MVGRPGLRGKRAEQQAEEDEHGDQDERVLDADQDLPRQPRTSFT